MVIHVDKWHFLPEPDAGCSLSADLVLENAQLARLNIVALVNPFSRQVPLPEMFVHCERPGERLTVESPSKRWVSRPPGPDCEWSNVELPPKLVQEINDKLGAQA